MERYFALAGSVVRITGPREDMFVDPGMLAPFEVELQEWDREIHCEMVERLSVPIGELVFTDPGRKVYSQGTCLITYIGSVENSLDGAYIRVERRGKQSVAQMKRSALGGRISAKTVLNALEAEHIVVDNGGLLLHASCICHDGNAVLFTAPSGIGKSTQAALWEQYRGAEIINGDRIMVRRTECGCEAIGIPFSGSSGICKKRKMPLKAIVYLKQARENEVYRLTGIKAFRSVWEGCSLHTWDRRSVEQCIKNVEQVIERIPVFCLACRPDVTAIEALEKELGITEE